MAIVWPIKTWCLFSWKDAPRQLIVPNYWCCVMSWQITWFGTEISGIKQNLMATRYGNLTISKLARNVDETSFFAINRSIKKDPPSNTVKAWITQRKLHKPLCDVSSNHTDVSSVLTFSLLICRYYTISMTKGTTEISIPANIYLFKVNNRNFRKRCEICSKLTIKTPERRQWPRSVVFYC